MRRDEALFNYKNGYTDGVLQVCDCILEAFRIGREESMRTLDELRAEDRLMILRVNEIFKAFSDAVVDVRAEVLSDGGKDGHLNDSYVVNGPRLRREVL